MNTITTLIKQWSSLWAAPERLPLSRWVEKHFHLSTQFATRNGLLKLYAFQRDLFDAFTDPRVTEITGMLAIQLTKTLFLQCVLAYVIAEDPGPVLLVEPKEQDAQAFSKNRLTPMLKTCPILADVMVGDTSRDKTILSKSFPGGSFTGVSALVPGNLAGRTIKTLLIDECDKFPESSGTAGDPIALAKGRTTNFGSLRKIIQTCSPTNKGESRIELAYESSDQRKPYVPCPFCGEFQILKWPNVKWGDALPEHLRSDAKEVPGPVYYKCAHCDGFINDVQRRKACELTVWRADKPFRGHAGFWISHLYSPWNSLEDLAADFLVAKKNKQTLKVFVTERLAELWEEAGIVPDDRMLYERRESYPFGADAVVPKGGLFLVAAVDVQENPPRLECAVTAYGRDMESWQVDYQVIQCYAPNDASTLLPATSPELWTELDKRVLQRDYQHELGGTLPIWLMAIDTGWSPQVVYKFCTTHPQPLFNISGGINVPSHRSVVAVKGNDDDLRIISTVSKENAARKRQNVRIVSIGTHACKTELFDNLRFVKPHPDGEPVPNCLHFPKYERSYFEGLCSERRVVTSSGVKWEKTSERNEPLDLAVMCRGAAEIVGIKRFKESDWQRLEKAVGTVTPQPRVAAAPTTPQAPTKPIQQAPQRRVVKFI